MNPTLSNSNSRKWLSLRTRRQRKLRNPKSRRSIRNRKKQARPRAKGSSRRRTSKLIMMKKKVRKTECFMIKQRAVNKTTKMKMNRPKLVSKKKVHNFSYFSTLLRNFTRDLMLPKNYYKNFKEKIKGKSMLNILKKLMLSGINNSNILLRRILKFILYM